MKVVRKIKGGEDLFNVAPSGYKVDHDPALCDTCGKCSSVCMFDAITADEHGRPVYNEQACMGCGLCVEHCSQKARSLNTEFNEGVLPLDIDLIEEAESTSR